MASVRRLHCQQWDVNSVYGMLLPPSEGGTFTAPGDTSTWSPASPAGLVQGAARWSKLASHCPQIAGVQIDDFLQNYVGTEPYTPPKPINTSGCVHCPAASPHVYGSATAGAFCCGVKSDGGHCTSPSTECCLTPGSAAGNTVPLHRSEFLTAVDSPTSPEPIPTPLCYV